MVHVNGQFPPLDAPWRELDWMICFDEHNYHNSLQARLIEGIGHYTSLIQIYKYMPH